MGDMRRQGRATRVARGAVAATFATFIALLSHMTAGGEMPGWIGVAVPLALSFVVCSALAGRRLSFWRLAVAVGLSQVLFHTLFVLGGFDAAAGHVHGAVAPLTSGAASPILQTDATMWAWHALAAALTTVALHRAERAHAVLRDVADRAVAWVRARARVVAASFGPDPVRRVFADVVVDVRAVSVVIVSSARRRGPPLTA